MNQTTWMVWLAVAGGSAAGGLIRHLLTESFGGASRGIPWVTIAVNAVGSLAIGAAFGLATADWPAPWPPAVRAGIMAGVLGGFTTFSAFSLQTVTLIHQGAWPSALANALGSVIVGLVACWAGLSMAVAVR